MADNYLENKMQEYRSGSNARRRRRAGRRVVVAGTDVATVLRVAAEEAASGSRVAVLNAPEGTPTTVRAYPPAVATAEALRRIIHDWHEVDLLVIAGEAPGVEEELAAQRAAIPGPLRSVAFGVRRL